MPKFRLRTYDHSPPGGYIYERDGSPKFTAPMIEPVAQALSAWRKANGKPRSSFAECLAAVDHYQCARLGNDPTYCIECGLTPATANVVAIGQTSPLINPCAGCGAPVQQQ